MKTEIAYKYPSKASCRDNEENLIVSKSDVLEVNLGAPEADEQFAVPDRETVKREIIKLKNNRASGKDQLPGEPFKKGGWKLTMALYCVISKVWK